MIARLLHRLRCERGFTLIELLVGVSVGTVVVLAALGLADASLRTGKRIDNRVEATQRGRVALDELVRLLRANVCVNRSPVVSPVESGTDTQVVFFAPTKANAAAATGAFSPDRWVLAFDAAAKTIKLDRYAGTGTYPATTWPALTSSRTVLTNARARTGVPFLRYYGADGAGIVDPVGGTPLSASPSVDIAKVAAVRLSFLAGPLKTNPDAKTDVGFDNVVSLRSVDPAQPTRGPQCRV